MLYKYWGPVNIYGGAFSENSEQLMAVIYFCKKFHHTFDKVLMFFMFCQRCALVLD